MKFWPVFFLLLLPQSAPEVEITAEPHHHEVFTNDQVRVFVVEVAPHSETLMHWHRHDYVYITLGPSQVVSAVKGKDPVAAKLNDGDTYFLPATFAHVARNLADTPFRNVTIEFLQDDKLRQLPKPAGDDRGLEILQGGTQQILWTKDSVRASEFELQPHATIPTQSTAHPVLLVAVNDLDLYTNDPRTHGAHESAIPPTHFKTGESVWLASGFKHPIVNAGRQSAKFVTLEFP